MKAAWEWTLDERIERRLDPVLMRERVAASENADDGAGRRRLQAAGFAGAASPFLVEGARNPELLMPTELFHSILDAAAIEDERRRYSARLSEFKWDNETFWRALDDATAAYRKLTAESIALQMSLS
ncbi:MAG TPA: hypothetical protein VJB15_07215, partial [Rhodothermia bacterium]|nr:hypothetical protein [Rhodothermia bacterium]